MRPICRRAATLMLTTVVLAGFPLPSPAGAARAPTPRPFGAECTTGVDGSRATARCHNPYPGTDRVQLHVECERWWDPDMDSRSVDIGPAGTVSLGERCWKEIRAVWVTHDRDKGRF